MKVLGFLIFLAAIAIFVLINLKKRYISEKNKNHPSQYRLENLEKFHIFFSLAKKKLARILLVIGILMFFFNNLFFWAEAGKQYFLVYPWGEKGAIMSQGFKPRMFAKITSWPKWIDVAAIVPGEEDKIDKKEMEGIMNPVDIRFIDQVTAKMYPALRFQIPVDKEDFIEFAIKYRTVENLVYNTLIPAVKEQCINTGYMFTAQDYISGAAQAFRQTFDEMLSYGSYVVEKQEIRDTTWAEPISSGAKQERYIKDIQTRYMVQKVLGLDGMPKRVKHEITENKLIVSQVIVGNLDLDPEYQERLRDQKSESAKRQLEQQKIETAKIAQQRVIAEGEQVKAQERVDREKEQVSVLIAIETQLKQEQTKRELEEIALKTEKLKAEKKKVAADAIFYENSKRVAAGLTPQEKATLEKEISIGVAAEIAKIKFPETLIITGKEQATPIESLIGAAMAKQLLK